MTSSVVLLHKGIQFQIRKEGVQQFFKNPATPNCPNSMSFLQPSDTLHMRSVVVPRSLYVIMGKRSESDRIYLEGTGVRGTTYINTGKGNDLLAIWGNSKFYKDFRAKGQTRLQTGLGDTEFLGKAAFSKVGDVKHIHGPSFEAREVVFAKGLELTMTSKPDRATFDQVDLKGRAYINTGGGKKRDTVVMNRTNGGQLTIRTGNGNDYVSMNSCVFNGGTRIVTGKGRDVVATRGDCRFVNFTFNAGKGNDRAFINESKLWGICNFNMGRGNDSVHMHNVYVHWARFRMSKGRDKVSMHNSYSDGRLEYDMGKGKDTVGIQNSGWTPAISGKVKIKMGGGDDRVYLNSTFTDKVTVLGGSEKKNDRLYLRGARFFSRVVKAGFEKVVR